MQKQEINTHEASKVIALYEGRINTIDGREMSWWSDTDGQDLYMWLDEDLCYYDSIELLWPVAKKVTDELDNTMKPDKIPGGVLNDAQFKLRQECNRVANRVRIAASEFDLPALFRAVHEAVGFVNENRKNGA